METGVDELEAQFTASRAIAVNLFALVGELAIKHEMRIKIIFRADRMD